MTIYLKAAACVLLFVVVAGTGPAFLRPVPSPASRIIVGDEKPLGEGTVRTWLRMNEAGEPEEIGVTVTQRALETLPPADSLPAPFHMYTMQLELPEEARAAGFDHVLFDWNAMGHDPMQLYSAPHFDVHFYLIDEAERLAIDPADPEFETKGMKEPDPEIVPADYFSPPGNFTVPQMGTHWLDRHTPELNGQPFTQTMLYGFYDGQMIFIEPMLTLEYLRSKPDLETEIKQPARYPRPGYYPTTYTIRYDETEASYTVSIAGLTKRS